MLRWGTAMWWRWVATVESPPPPSLLSRAADVAQGVAAHPACASSGRFRLGDWRRRAHVDHLHVLGTLICGWSCPWRRDTINLRIHLPEEFEAVMGNTVNLARSSILRQGNTTNRPLKKMELSVVMYISSLPVSMSSDGKHSCRSDPLSMQPFFPPLLLHGFGIGSLCLQAEELYSTVIKLSCSLKTRQQGEPIGQTFNSIAVCHQDLKLENTLLDGTTMPCLKIYDFGYSKGVVCMSWSMCTLILHHEFLPSTWSLI